MAAAQFYLVTDWSFEAPVEPVWQALMAREEWPAWWRAVAKVEPMTLIEGRAEGELAGLGRWTLRPDGARTHVRYEWIVEVTKPWMRFAAPLLRPVFAWNHGKVMDWGYEGLTRKLAAR